MFKELEVECQADTQRIRRVFLEEPVVKSPSIAISAAMPVKYASGDEHSVNQAWIMNFFSPFRYGFKDAVCAFCKVMFPVAYSEYFKVVFTDNTSRYKNRKASYKSGFDKLVGVNFGAE